MPDDHITPAGFVDGTERVEQLLADPELATRVAAIRRPHQQCRNAARHEPHEWTDYEITMFVFYCEGVPGKQSG